MSITPRLKIALQKSGRLTEDSLELLSKCGIRLVKSKDQLFCSARNFPLDVYFVRDDDIPAFVATHVCQLGIVGKNVLLEKQARDEAIEGAVETVEELSFGQCRLSVAIPQGFTYEDNKSLENKVIATSYPGLLKNWLNSNQINARIVTMRGAVEIAPRTHMADAICDLVSTGSTMAVNGLKEVATIMKSKALLIKNAELDDEEKSLFNRLMLRINGALRAEQSKYIMLHCPADSLDDIKKALPGVESPTVLPLQGRPDLMAVHAVCNEEVFWDTMEDLKARGASAILVLPVEKMVD